MVGWSKAAPLAFSQQYLHPTAPRICLSARSAHVLYAFQYACRIAVQQGHQEEISDFKVHFKELLKEFYKRTNQKKPEAIIYYWMFLPGNLKKCCSMSTAKCERGARKWATPELITVHPSHSSLFKSDTTLGCSPKAKPTDQET
ncbi:hypothetical protein BSKO_09500 [Bryopsis sp. KO-2023]|nr:hypothetical protein BSKO_09500 [Bryopsis sp. KO-2023]